MGNYLTMGGEKPLIDIIVADNEVITLTQIHKIISSIGSVTTVNSQQAMFATLSSKKHDIVILGFDFESNVDDINIINAIKKIDNKIKVIKILHQDDVFNVRCLLRFGVQGFIRIEDVRTGALYGKANRLFSQEFYLDEVISALLIEDEISPLHQKLRSCLSKKECEVVLRLFTGDTVTEISQKTNRSVKTVSGQKISAMKKLDTKNNFELFSLLSTFNQCT